MNHSELIAKAKEYRERFNALRKEYKEKQLSLLNTRKSELKNYSDEYIQEQIKREKGQLAEAHKKLVKDYFESTEIYLKDCIKKIEELRYPLTTGSDYGKIQLELIRQRAFNYLSQVTDLRKIENQLRDALLIDENYFSSMLEILEARRKGNYELKPEERDFYSRVDKMKKDFELKKGISELQRSREKFRELTKETERYLEALDDGHIIYYTKTEVENMKQDEVAKEYDFVSASMPYWS